MLHFLTQTELTGSEVFAFHLIQQQLAAGDHVTVVSDQFHLPFACDKVQWPLSPAGLRSKFRSYFFLKKLIQDLRPDILHCHSRGASRHASAARIGLRVPMVTTLHGRQHYSYSKRFIKKSFGDHITCVCENIFLDLQNKFGFSPKVLSLVRNPVPQPKSKSIPERTLNLGWVGRASGPKGQRLLALVTQVFPSLLAEFPDLKIEIICSGLWAGSISGSANLEIENLKSQISKLHAKFPKRFVHQDSSADLQSWFQQMSFVIGGGRVAIEAALGGAHVFVLGENTWHGPMWENWQACLASNFGDVGLGVREEVVDWKKAIQQISNSIKIKITDRTGSSNSGIERSGLPQTGTTGGIGPDAHTPTKEGLHLLLAEDFEPAKIFFQFQQIYRRVRFEFFAPNWIPVLMYHKIPIQELESQHKIWVTKSRFESHLRFFKRRGLTSLHWSQLADFWLVKKSFNEFPKKPFVLTFDDGYLDNLTHAQPLLEKFGFKASLFLLSDSKIQKNFWDLGEDPEASQLLGAEDRKKLNLEIFEIGSHGSTHRSLLQLPDEEISQELFNSKKDLEKEFQTSVVAFAYPFGHREARLEEFVAKAGYVFAVNTDQGGSTLPENPFSIFRVNIFPKDGWFALWKKTSPWYRNYFFRKKTTGDCPFSPNRRRR